MQTVCPLAAFKVHICLKFSQCKLCNGALTKGKGQEEQFLQKLFCNLTCPFKKCTNVNELGLESSSFHQNHKMIKIL